MAIEPSVWGSPNVPIMSSRPSAMNGCMCASWRGKTAGAFDITSSADS
jgi:hypothetical protein